MRHKKDNKLLVILGPTATGKTKLAVRLASSFAKASADKKKFGGEIVSADSRQVYRGMDVGTGKDLSEFRIKNAEFRIKQIPYHLIDVVSPGTEFNLAKYVKLAKKAIVDIQRRGKLPILVGGSGLYLQAVVDGYSLSGVGPDKKLRARLERKSVDELQKLLQKLYGNYYGNLSNKRYLIRYIEMVSQSRKKLSSFTKVTEDKEKLLVKKGSEYDCLVLGVKFSRAEINKRIDKRLVHRINNEHLIKEVERLHRNGVSWKRLENFGLEYKYVSQYLQGKMALDEMVVKLSTAIHQFAKRQMTWFRRWEKQGRCIEWIGGYREGVRLARRWLGNGDVKSKT